LFTQKTKMQQRSFHQQHATQQHNNNHGNNNIANPLKDHLQQQPQQPHVKYFEHDLDVPIEYYASPPPVAPAIHSTASPNSTPSSSAASSPATTMHTISLTSSLLASSTSASNSAAVQQNQQQHGHHHIHHHQHHHHQHSHSHFQQQQQQLLENSRVEEYDMKYLEKIKKMDTRITYEQIFNECCLKDISPRNRNQQQQNYNQNRFNEDPSASLEEIQFQTSSTGLLSPNTSSNSSSSVSTTSSEIASQQLSIYSEKYLRIIHNEVVPNVCVQSVKPNHFVDFVDQVELFYCKHN